MYVEVVHSGSSEKSTDRGGSWTVVCLMGEDVWVVAGGKRVGDDWFR